MESTADAHTSTGVLQDGTKVTFPLRRLITNSLGTPRPCNDSSMLRRVRNCRCIIIIILLLKHMLVFQM